ncbi:MAG: hypothetical protein K2Y33_12845, partial [Mycolicibacterium frederiksbergense]|nr:hypothetical protein [Mycolicibacterium frederiksbergense]
MTDPIIEKPAKNYDYSGFERAEVGEAPVREPERITPVRPAYSEGPTHRPARTAPRPGGTGSGGTGFRPVSGDGPAKHAGAFRKEKPAFNSDKPAFNKGKPSFSKGKPVFGEDRSSRDERSDRADRPRFEGRSAAAPGFAPRKNFG